MIGNPCTPGKCYAFDNNEFVKSISCPENNISVTTWNINYATIKKEWFFNFFNEILEIKNKISFYQEVKCIYTDKTCAENYKDYNPRWNKTSAKKGGKEFEYHFFEKDGKIRAIWNRTGGKQVLNKNTNNPFNDSHGTVVSWGEEFEYIDTFIPAYFWKTNNNNKIDLDNHNYWIYDEKGQKTSPWIILKYLNKHFAVMSVHLPVPSNINSARAQAGLIKSLIDNANYILLNKQNGITIDHVIFGGDFNIESNRWTNTQNIPGNNIPNWMPEILNDINSFKLKLYTPNSNNTNIGLLCQNNIYEYNNKGQIEKLKIQNKNDVNDDVVVNFKNPQYIKRLDYVVADKNLEHVEEKIYGINGESIADKFYNNCWDHAVVTQCFKIKKEHQYDVGALLNSINIIYKRKEQLNKIVL